MITYNLFPDEQQFIKKLAEIKTPKENNDMEIDSYFPTQANEFLDLFAANRGLKNGSKIRAKWDVRLAYFGNVPMHTDSLCGSKYKTLIVFIKGKGLLSHYESFSNLRKRKIKETYLIGGECLVLDDALPHSYFNQSKDKSLAIIADIPLTWLKKAKEKELAA